MSMNILGISAFYHDSAATLVRDGSILAAAQEERFTRKKHDDSFPKHAVDYCCRVAGITPANVDYVVFYEKPFIKFERLLETYLAYAPLGFPSYLQAIPVWIKKKIWLKDYLRTELKFKGDILFPEHHQSHAASAFYPSPFQSAAILTLDGVGEWDTTTYGVGNGNTIELLGSIKFPHSLGLLYSAFTYYLGFKVNSGEYKVMGLAAYGTPRYATLFYDRLIDVKPDGTFHLNMEYFNYCTGLTMTNQKLDNLFGGPPRKPETGLTQRDMDIASSLQFVTEDIMLKMAKNIRRITGQRYLCLAGGVALNCVANGRILREKIFSDLWIQPAAGDAGGSLGAALLTWYGYLGKKRYVTKHYDSMRGAYLGPEYSHDDIESFLRKHHLPYTKLSRARLLSQTASFIAHEKVVGWFQGRMEFGPRALGNRSILGDARSFEMQKNMNLKIKFRESFRPFAPAILSDHVNDCFDMNHDSPYMLLVAYVAKKYRLSMKATQNKVFGLDKLYLHRSKIPAVTHVDFSARVQTVHHETNPLFYDLIRQFYKQTKYPVIINTSFNVRGEPIVLSPQDAYLCFMRTQMDYLVLGNYILDKKKQPPLRGDIDWKKQFVLD